MFVAEKVQARSASTAHKSPYDPPVYIFVPSKEKATHLHEPLLFLCLFLLFDDDDDADGDDVCKDKDANRDSYSSSLSSAS